MNLTEKRLSCQNCRYIFINFRLLVVYLTYIPQAMTRQTIPYNLFLDDGQQWLKNNRYNFISWKHVRKYSQQICNSLFVDIICIGLYMLVSVTYSAIIYMCNRYNCGVKHRMRLSKMVKYLYKIILITQITLSCVVKFKQTTVICNKRYVLVTIEFITVTGQCRGWAFCPKWWAFCPHMGQLRPFLCKIYKVVLFL